MKKILVIITLTCSLIFSGSSLFAQDYQVDESLSSISLNGTSSLHDWHMRASSFTGLFNLKTQEGELVLKSVKIKVKSSDITSSKNIMNRKAADALKTEKYPWIIFEMTKVESLNFSKGKLSGSIKGNLSIAGVTREVTFPFTGFRTADNSVISAEGSIKLKMTDYGVEPPEALLGKVETDDLFVLNYKVTLKKEN
ncbi:MAG: YceI family protein [Bacteroidales bacterium]|jgi:polyisoprenoid-binding protein YceI|nr:YceI family protein [Bacteroidales bacterium]